MEEFFGLSSDIQKNSETGYILFYQSREWTHTVDQGRELVDFCQRERTHGFILWRDLNSNAFLWLAGPWRMHVFGQIRRDRDSHVTKENG